jgi:hypothetical protein
MKDTLRRGGGCMLKDVLVEKERTSEGFALGISYF